MENIFKDAKFGEVFKCKNGKKAIFWYSLSKGTPDEEVVLITEDRFRIRPSLNGHLGYYKDDTTYVPNKHDIISKLQKK